MKLLTIIPKISEKAYAVSKRGENKKTYVFVVPTDANKHSIAREVARQFEVEVENVTTLTTKGKKKLSYRKGSKPTAGQRSDAKKAYVTLKSGFSLPIFQEEETEEAEAKKTDDRKAKKVKKESK